MDLPTPEADNVRITTPSQSGRSGSLHIQEKFVTTAQKSTTNDNDTIQQSVPTISLNLKRHRVSWACDICRRGKIKCDGKRPCTHCTVYSYDCTFDQPSKRRRHVAPQYVEVLETQLKRAKMFLSVLCPTLDLGNDSIESHVQTAAQNRPLVRTPRTQRILRDPSVLHGAGRPPSLHLEHMVELKSLTCVQGEAGNIQHNHHTQLRLQRHAESVTELSSGNVLPFAKCWPASSAHDTPQPVVRSIANPVTDVRLRDTNLPSRMLARRLCKTALLGTSILVHVVHVPTFNQSMERIYDTPPENYGATENTFLALLYAVLAVGVLLSDETELAELGFKPFTNEGLKYFQACRRLLHIADCNDLISLQAFVFMIQFSLAFTKLSTCYSYIGVALRSAMHMGLHRSSNASFNPIDAEVRKRLFWSIRKMDTYVGTMLGLPIYLSDEDVDQDWPIEVEDEQITGTTIHSRPGQEIPILAASNAHTRIVQIFAKICKHMYPIKGSQSGAPSVTGLVSCMKIAELENDLERWTCDLPSVFKVGGVVSPTLTRQRVPALLQVAYCHARMLLYRPFLHYLSQSRTDWHIDQRAIACANACINASREIVRIAIEMKQQGLLVAADWLTTYSTFSALVSILDYITENPYHPAAHDSYQDAIGGKSVLVHLAKRSVAAGRCASTLITIFDRLPNVVKRYA